MCPNGHVQIIFLLHFHTHALTNTRGAPRARAHTVSFSWATEETGFSGPNFTYIACYSHLLHLCFKKNIFYLFFGCLFTLIPSPPLPITPPLSFWVHSSSQVTHTCGLPVKDLYNTTHPATDTGGHAFDNMYSAEMYGQVATNIVRNHDASQPLFLYLAFLNCHAPNQAPKSYRDRFPHLTAGGSRRCYAGMMAAMDDAVGNVTTALRARPDMYANSIVIFSTDNGGPGHDASNVPLRGAKFSTWEGGVRGVAFLHSPLLPQHGAGSVYHGLLHLTDWYATFAALAGVDTDKTGPVPADGYNVWNAIATGAPSPRQYIVHEYDNVRGIYAFRNGSYKVTWGDVGDDKWIPDIDYETADCKPLLKPRRPLSHNAQPLLGSGSSMRDEEAGPGNGIGRASMSAAAVDSEHKIRKKPKPSLCTVTQPCLFDILSDPEEHHELGNTSAGQAIVSAMQAQLKEIVASRYTGGLDHAVTSQDDYCKWISKSRWVGPYEK